MNKIFKKGLILFIITLIGLTVFLWFDDSLTPLSKEILEYEVKHQPVDNGEVYLWCFSCKTDDVYTAGSELVSRVNEYIKSNNFSEDFEYKNEHHNFASEGILCDKFDDACDIFTVADSIAHDQFTNDYNWAINRYFEYLSFEHYIDQTHPNFAAPLPSYKDIVNAQKTYHLSLLSDSNLNVNLLIGKLSEELIKTKRVLGKVDALIQRMILAVLIGENIELVNQLQQKRLLEGVDLTLYLAQLTISKKHFDLTAVLKRDYVGVLDFYDESSDIAEMVEKKKTSSLNKVFLKFLFKFVYKPNMNINFITYDLVQPLSLTTMKPKQFFNEAQYVPKKEEMNQYRNFLGHRAMKKLKPSNWHEYTARIHSLHNKMILLKSLIHYGSIDEINNNLNSDDFSHKNLFNDELPYFERGHYCFSTLEGILARPKDLCLRIIN